MSYVFHPAAEAEHLETVAYLESKRPGLAALYLADFEHVIGMACEAPQRYHIERSPDVRRIGMMQFPYAVLYRVSSAVVQVLAVARQLRRASYWMGRL